jgi:hypothetical protein
MLVVSAALRDGFEMQEMKGVDDRAAAETSLLSSSAQMLCADGTQGRQGDRSRSFLHRKGSCGPRPRYLIRPCPIEKPDAARASGWEHEFYRLSASERRSR